MNPLETFIQTGICWAILILFVKYHVIGIIEFFVETYEDEPINYQI